MMEPGKKMIRNNILNKLIENLAVVVPTHAIALLCRDQQTGSYYRQHGDRPCSAPGLDFLDSADPAIRRLHNGEELALWAPAERPCPDREVRENTAAALFPIIVQGFLDYVLVVAGNQLPESDIRVVGAFCREASLPLETLAAQENLKRKIEQLSCLVSLVDAASTGQNDSNLLQTVLDGTAELLLAEQGSIMLIERETDALLLEAARGALQESVRQFRARKGEGIAGKVAERGEPILVEDVEHDPRIGKKNYVRYKTASFVSVPIKIDSRVIGVMNFTDKATGGSFDDEDLQLAQTCAAHAAVLLDRKEMSEQAESLRQEATTDHLTGLLNRRGVLHRLQEELSRSDRYAKTMSLIVLDVDGFKGINDHFGHATGDRVLRRISELMTKAVRSIDIIGRYGGDEFIIILPETDEFFGKQMAERVLADVATTDFSCEVSNRAIKKITVSMGIATFPFHGTSPDVLIDHADEALYRAKAGGRDRVVVY